MKKQNKFDVFLEICIMVLIIPMALGVLSVALVVGHEDQTIGLVGLGIAGVCAILIILIGCWIDKREEKREAKATK